MHTAAGGFHQHQHTTAPPSGALAGDTDPLALGVHRARRGGDGGAALPPYVRRDVDGRVRDALRTAAAAGGMVLLTGDSTAGKSRTALEAVRAVLPGHLLPAPPRAEGERWFAEALDKGDERAREPLSELRAHLAGMRAEAGGGTPSS
ncbi:hypothetical protein OG900_03935 [Streptomyces sp. NBC_00433]